MLIKKNESAYTIYIDNENILLKSLDQCPLFIYFEYNENWNFIFFPTTDSEKFSVYHKNARGLKNKRDELYKACSDGH